MSAHPELTDLFGRIQRLDAQLGVSFRKVPVPEGLQQRLLQRLEAARCEPTSDAAADAVASDEELQSSRSASPSHPCASVRPARRLPSRRRLLSIAGVLSAAAALLVAVWIPLHNARPYTESVVLEQARAFFMAEASGGPSAAGGGYLLSDPARPAPSELPLSRSLARVPGIKWREISGFLGSRGIAYDIAGRQGHALRRPTQRRLTALASAPEPRVGHRRLLCRGVAERRVALCAGGPRQRRGIPRLHHAARPADLNRPADCMPSLHFGIIRKIFLIVARRISRIC